LIGATFFALFVFPLIVEWVYSKMLYDKEGNLLQRKL
jgi:cobalt-zinc-cadmium resistance protein CzcA